MGGDMKLYRLLSGVSFELITGELDVEVSGLEDNSKRVCRGNLFFAINGTRVNGEDYILEAINNGAEVVVTQSDTIPEGAKGITFVKVDNVRKVIGIVAKNYYCPNGYSFKIIGITGTNGKTTTSFMIGDGLEQNGYNVCVVGTSGIFVNGKQLRGEYLTTPDPIELQSLFGFLNSIYVDYVVMEVSAHALDLEKLNGVEFNYSIFSNLTEDHLDYFGNMENYGLAKKKLFMGNLSKVKIINTSDEFGREIAKVGAISYGECESDYKIEKIDNNCFKLTNNNFKIKIKLNISGIYNFYNATASIIVLLSEGVKPKFIKKYFRNLKIVDGRYNEFSVRGHGKVVLDFAHTPDGLEKLLHNVRENMKGVGRLISVFGCGGNRDPKKRPIMGRISGQNADYTIISIDNPRREPADNVMADIQAGVQEVTDKYEIIMPRSLAILRAINMSEPSDVVVISGKGTEPYYEVNGKKEFYREDIVIDCIRKNLEK